ncbi:MAG: 3-dehydro-L-gulonate 2-dehydrogenase [Bacteroidota bacterium]|nr:3-dehydro-L-gulonate 2-dehydrogenase [Bacteroidota bacterium]
MLVQETMLLVPASEMQSAFSRILLKHGFTGDKAEKCAAIFTASSVDGVYTHGVNRFPRFIEYVLNNYVKPGAEPFFKHRAGCIEQWDGNFGPGPLNATFATERAMELARESGMGCVTLSNTNHWMRAGTYGWQAAKKGFAYIGFTNTIANMPAWGAKDKRLGNNPLVIALPYKDEAIVLDMAMSQYSFGALELAKMKNEKLSVGGGFDKEGNLTKDPASIIESGRLLPVGFWKGAGLSLMLDMLAALLSGGLSTHEISRKEAEYSSQVFIAIDISKLGNQSTIPVLLENIIRDYHQSVAIDKESRIVYPGERILETRRRNLEQGIPVLRQVWDAIMQL